jgi:hypothetical protein
MPRYCKPKDGVIMVEFLAYSPYFENKNKESRLMLSQCCLCVCQSPLLTFEFLNQSLVNLVRMA